MNRELLCRTEVLDGPDLVINEWALIMSSLETCAERYGNAQDMSLALLLAKLKRHFQLDTVQ